jgi:hypothetical protein
MTTFTLIALAITATLLFIIRAKPRTKTDLKETNWPFYPKKPLSNPEQVLYFRLAAALPNHIILGQVQLSRILGVKKGHNYNQWNNRINRMSTDFVICSKNATIVAVIELDDSTHERPDRKKADLKKDKALASAGIKLIRWNVKSMPDTSTIQCSIHQNEIVN